MLTLTHIITHPDFNTPTSHNSSHTLQAYSLSHWFTHAAHNTHASVNTSRMLSLCYRRLLSACNTQSSFSISLTLTHYLRRLLFLNSTLVMERRSLSIR